MSLFQWRNLLGNHSYKEYSVEADNYCRVAWNNRRSRGQIKENLSQIKDQDIKNFGCDIFQILHEGEYEETFDGESWGSPVLGEVLDSNEFQILMGTCEGDADFSAFSTSSFLLEAHESLSKIKSMYKKKEDIDKDDSLSEEEKEDMKSDVDFDLENMIPYIKADIGRASLNALSKVSDVADLREKGLIPSGTSDDSDIELAEARFDIVERLQKDENFRRILTLAGRVASLGHSATTVRTDAPEDFVGFATGNEIEGIQLEDLALLGEEDLEDLFWAEFAEETLVIDQFKGTEELGYGDVILCTDVSPSMGAHLGRIGEELVTRHQVCRAFSYAMHCDISKDRKVIEIPFNHLAINIITDPMTSINKGMMGGTNFNNAFNKANKHIGELNNPDIIFITDGEDHIYPDILEKIKEQGVRIWLYTIGNRPNPVLERYSHRSYVIGSDIQKSIENLTESMKATK